MSFRRNRAWRTVLRYARHAHCARHVPLAHPSALAVSLLHVDVARRDLQDLQLRVVGHPHVVEGRLVRGRGAQAGAVLVLGVERIKRLAHHVRRRRGRHRLNARSERPCRRVPARTESSHDTTRHRMQETSNYNVACQQPKLYELIRRYASCSPCNAKVLGAARETRAGVLLPRRKTRDMDMPR